MDTEFILKLMDSLAFWLIVMQILCIAMVFGVLCIIKDMLEK